MRDLSLDHPPPRARERPDRPGQHVPAAAATSPRRRRSGPTRRAARATRRRRDARRASRRPPRRSKGGAGEISFARPYTTDFLGWFDDFSTTGGGFDALGAYARGHAHDRPVGPLHEPTRRARSSQYKRCPGAAEAPPTDGSNVLQREERERLDCDEADRAVPMRRALDGHRVVARRVRRGVRARRAPTSELGQAQRLQDRVRQRLRPHRGRRLPRRRRARPARPAASTLDEEEGRAAAGASSPPRSRSPASPTSARTRRCEIRPQSLIGEYYVDCQPGSSDERLRRTARHGPGRADRRRRSRSTSSAHHAPPLPRAARG